MNKDNAHLFLPLVQALADGKTLQLNIQGRWYDVYKLTFECDPKDYRIKPEPIRREVWVHEKDATKALLSTVYNTTPSMISWLERNGYRKMWVVEEVK